MTKGGLGTNEVRVEASSLNSNGNKMDIVLIYSIRGEGGDVSDGGDVSLKRRCPCRRSS